jgi:hypothetical protein
VKVGLHVDGAQVNFTYLSLKDYLGIAYQLKAHQIVGPDWIASDRFQVRFHREPREFPVYALVTGKTGPKLKASAAESDADNAEGKQANVNVTAFADVLARFMDRRVVDLTEIKGDYDLKR